MDDQLEHLDSIYDLPWNRIGPYMIGLITAYILAIRLNHKLVISKKTRIFLWTVFPLLNLWILFTLYTREMSVEFSAFYMGVSRTLWGVGIAWVVVATVTGNARLLEKFLSFNAWIPLSRLTYCAYLLNPLVVIIISMGSETPVIISIPSQAVTANGVLLISFLMSFLVSMLFESPFILLTKLAFEKIAKNPKRNPTNRKPSRNGITNGNGKVEAGV